MIIRPNENRKQSVTNKTIRGLYINAFLAHNAVNTLLLDTQFQSSLGFDPSQININLTLKRAGKTFVMVNTNLGILGQYSTMLKGAKQWIKGTDVQRPSATEKHLNYRGLFLDLEGYTNVSSTDELEISVSCGRNAFNSDSLDVPACYLDVNPVYGIGKEHGVIHIATEVIQANTSRDQFNLGDNITKVAFLNFEDTDVTSQIIQTLSVSSDRLDQTYSLAELILNHESKFGKQAFKHPYASAVGDPSTLDNSVSCYPQSFVILNDEEIDRATVDITFDQTKVNASKNALVFSYFLTSQEIIQKSIEMEKKHHAENMAKVPATL